MRFRIFTTVLSIILASLSIVPSSFAAPTELKIVVSPFESNQSGNENAQEQLFMLKSLGLIQEDIQTQDFEPSLPEIANRYQEIQIIEQKSKVLIQDTSDGKTYDNVDQFIRSKNEPEANSKNFTGDVSIASNNIYVVHFFSFVGNPDTANADYVHTAEVTSCYGLDCPDNYLVQLTLETSDYRYYGFSSTDYESDTVGEDEEVALIYPVNDTKYFKFIVK